MFSEVLFGAVYKHELNPQAKLNRILVQVLQVGGAFYGEERVVTHSLVCLRGFAVLVFAGAHHEVYYFKS